MSLYWPGPVARLRPVGTSPAVRPLAADWGTLGAVPEREKIHDDVIKWKHFPRYWPFVRGIHRSPVNSPHKGQWRGALMFSLIYARINGWANIRKVGDLRHHRAHYDVTVMQQNMKWNFNDVNIIPAHDLAPCIPRTSAGMVLTA